MPFAPEYGYYVERVLVRSQDPTAQKVLEQVHANKYESSESVSEADLTLLADAAQVDRESVLAVRDAVLKDRGVLDVPGKFARYSAKMPTQAQISRMPADMILDVQARVAQRVAAFRAVQAAAASEARKKAQAEGSDVKELLAQELDLYRAADLAHAQAQELVTRAKQVDTNARALSGHGLLWWSALAGAGWLVVSGIGGLFDGRD